MNKKQLTVIMASVVSMGGTNISTGVSYIDPDIQIEFSKGQFVDAFEDEAGPLEVLYGLENTLNSTSRSYTRLMTGTHNIGVGTLTSAEVEGNADFGSVDRAATELAVEAASFVGYSLSPNGSYFVGSHRVAPSDLAIIER
ncbi:hypothetical protein C942_01349 [Photobacterium marinum]|uniref:Uncharacterized protein n=1 Tax=Photobacterium marinum TaxID=1056511 RepID=L8JF14_9GAMM|nr:hypothetical protein [Photobacterium marinum]ELR67420.1 hypothetical protein C942_01349 [Photobacterium marinum]